jgi:hypothetical protein
MAMVKFNINNSKLINNLRFYRNFLVSRFVNGGSWKLDRITELSTREKRRIMLRSKSAYEELFGQPKHDLNP